MSPIYSLLKKEELKLDLRELGKEILRELFFFSQHLSLHREHPAKNEATKKLFSLLKKFFRLRSYFDFHLYRGELYTLGIPQNEEVFIRALKTELSRFSLGSIFIYSQVNPEELAIFFRRLGEKTFHSSRHLDLQRFLEEKRITSIRVKRSEPEDPFLEECKALAERGEDFSLRTLAGLSLREEPGVIMDILLKKIVKEIDLEGRVILDFRLRVFQSVIFEEFSRLSVDQVMELMLKELKGKNRETILEDKKYLEGMKSLVEAIENHSQADYLSSRLKEILASLGISEDFLEEILGDNKPHNDIPKLVCG